MIIIGTLQVSINNMMTVMSSTVVLIDVYLLKRIQISDGWRKGSIGIFDPNLRVRDTA